MNKREELGRFTSDLDVSLKTGVNITFMFVFFNYIISDTAIASRLPNVERDLQTVMI